MPQLGVYKTRLYHYSRSALARRNYDSPRHCEAVCCNSNGVDRARSELIKQKHIQKVNPLKLNEPRTLQPNPLQGASVEWQMTGKDSVGGFQLQIIPQHQTDAMHFSNTADTIKDSYTWISHTPSSCFHSSFNALLAPKDQGLKDGDLIHVKDLRKQKPERPKVVRDLWREFSPDQPTTLDLEEYPTLDLEIFYEKHAPKRFGIHWLTVSNSLEIFEVRDISNVFTIL